MCIKCHTVNLSIDLDGLEPEFKRVAKQMYAGKFKPGQIDAAMTKKIAKQLLTSFWEGYGDGPAMQESFIKNIEQNIFVFSGFKNYQQLKEASSLLANSDGSYKNFNQWFKDIRQVNETYNEVYARAEHANALASAQAISSWNDYQEFGVTRLRFETAGDSRVRPEHAILNGTVVDIGDPMLDKYYTPLDWGCRCEWVPAIDEDLTGWGDLPNVPPMFQTNIAKTGVIFPDTHPYFYAPKPISDYIIKQANDWALEENPRFEPKGITEYENQLGVEIDRGIFKDIEPKTKLTNIAFDQNGKAQGAFYSSQNQTVNIPIDDRRKKSKWYSKAVVYHEFGHAHDFQLGLKSLPSVSDLMTKYRRKYAKNFMSMSNEIDVMGYKAYQSGDFDLSEKIGAVADTIMSLNKKYGAGHRYKVKYKGVLTDYFDVPGMKEAEFIAHAFENRFAGNDVFKSFMPELYDDMITLVDNFFKP